MTSTQSENTANLGHILAATELRMFELNDGVQITNSVIEQVIMYMFVYLMTISKQTNKELIAHIQR